MPAENDWRPALRADVLRAADTILWDPVLSRRVNIGPVSRALVDRLDGTRRLGELLTEVGASLPEVSPAAIEHSFRALLLMLVVEGTGTETLAKARAATAGATLPLIALDEARFACQGSTSCCRGYAYGPMSPDDIARIAALDLASAFPHLAASGADWKMTRPESQDSTMVYLAFGEGGRCTFLLDDGRCGIHAHFGAEHKPTFCRMYPLSHRPTISGWKIFDAGECASFSRSARSGKRYLDDQDRIRTLLPPTKDMELLHPLVFLDERTPCDFGAVLSLEETLCDLVASHAGDATSIVVAVGRQVERFVDVMTTCPLAPGEPAAALTRALALAQPPPATLQPQGAGLAAIATLSRALFRLGTDALPRAIHAHIFLGHEYTRQCMAALHGLLALAVHRQEPSDDPLIADYEHALAIPLPAEADAMWRVSLRQQIFGDRLVIDEHLRAGALRLVFIYLAAIMGAKLSAAAAGRTIADADDLDLGHTAAMRLLHREVSSEIMKDHQHLTWSVFAAVPMLLGVSEELTPRRQ